MPGHGLASCSGSPVHPGITSKFIVTLDWWIISFLSAGKIRDAHLSWMHLPWLWEIQSGDHVESILLINKKHSNPGTGSQKCPCISHPSALFISEYSWVFALLIFHPPLLMEQVSWVFFVPSMVIKIQQTERLGCRAGMHPDWFSESQMDFSWTSGDSRSVAYSHISSAQRLDPVHISMIQYKHQSLSKEAWMWQQIEQC